MRRHPCARCVSTSPQLSLRPTLSLPIIVTIVSHHENCTLKRFTVYMLLFVNKDVAKLTHGNIVKEGVVAQLLCFSHWVSLWKLMAKMKLLKNTLFILDPLWKIWENCFKSTIYSASKTIFIRKSRWNNYTGLFNMSLHFEIGSTASMLKINSCYFL